MYYLFISKIFAHRTVTKKKQQHYYFFLALQNRGSWVIGEQENIVMFSRQKQLWV